MASSDDIRNRWLAQMLSTEPASRSRAEAAVRELYAAAGFDPPCHLFWFDSPFDACWANALLTAPHSFTWTQMVKGMLMVKAYREDLDRVRSIICKSAGESNFEEVLAAVGPPIGSPFRDAKPTPGGAAGMMVMKSAGTFTKTLQSELFVARVELHGGLPPASFNQNDPLILAEIRLFGSNGGVLTCQMKDRAVNSFLGMSFLAEYGFAKMADDEQKLGIIPPPMILNAGWNAARSSGPWWPYTKAALMTERPVEIRLNARSLLHCGDGPAARYRDGTPVFAWNGQPLPQRWILNPETLTARELREFHADFHAHVAARVGTASSEVRPKPTKRKPSASLKLVLSADHARRLDELRAFNKGRLPHLERYLSGEHEKVWQDLRTLGPAVREDPHAADALAVAYETMRRVDANVRTVTARLREMGYAFKTEAMRTENWVDRAESAMTYASKLVQPSAATPHVQNIFTSMNEMVGKLAEQIARVRSTESDPTVRAHVPPGRDARKQIARLEKTAGVLPLSLRVFYDVVGAVDWTGSHPGLSPKNGMVCPDPLVVYGIEDALQEARERINENAEGICITIAPDDLHKADTSGGDPYEIGLPDLGADAELLNERHRLPFVDYLRLCFRFGGFPGYEGMDSVPAEIKTLCEDLLAF
jgi:hypothetical protein